MKEAEEGEAQSTRLVVKHMEIQGQITVHSVPSNVKRSLDKVGLGTHLHYDKTHTHTHTLKL